MYDIDVSSTELSKNPTANPSELSFICSQLLIAVNIVLVVIISKLVLLFSIKSELNSFSLFCLFLFCEVQIFIHVRMIVCYGLIVVVWL